MQIKTHWLLLVLLALMLGSFLPSHTATIAAQGSEPPTIGQSIKNDTSPPLRDIQPISTTPSQPPKEHREKKETKHKTPGPLVIDPVKQGSFGPGPAAPSAINNFEGVGNIDGVYPPDTNGDVGPNHFVQWVNLHFQIWDKSGKSLYGPAAGNSLWRGFGGPCETTNDGDPIVLYDSMADRWLMSQFAASGPYGECVAISTTGDPTGSYYRYFFQFSTSIFYDYPHFGVWPDGYYMSANRFTAFFLGASAIAFNRAQMLNGQPATFQEFKTSTSYGTLLPSDLDGAALPPSGSPNFFAEIGTTALHLWKFHVDWATPANSTFNGPSSLSVAAYNELCPFGNCIPQPSTSVKLDGLGDRLMHRLAYRNFGDHESLVVNHGVNAASSGLNAGVRWYELRSPNSAPSIYQQGTFAPDANHRWMASVAMDKSGNIALGYSVSSSSVSPSIRYTGRLAGDPLGQMTQGETQLIAGSGSQTGSAGRWGDYAMMTIDPVDECTFWFTTEYMPTTGPAPWQTRIGSFKFPSCGGPPTAPGAPVLSATAGNATVHLSWTAPSDGGSAITSYKVYRGTTSGGETLLTTLGNVTSYDDNAVTNGVTYYYEVRAVNGIGEGAPSNEVSATPQAATAPGAPQNLTATGVKHNGVRLSWSAPASDGGSAISGYRIYRSTTSGAESFLVAVGNLTTYDDTSATRGVLYYYQVTAVNSVGEGPRSNEASAKAR